MILMIDNYDSFTYNVVQLLAALGADVRVERNDALTAGEAIALAPAGIVISPGPGTPPQAGISKDIVRAAADAGIPLLGVCLGHQCIAEVYGGTVGRAPVPVHGKTAEVHHDGTGLLAGMSDPFTATRYHSLTVEEDTLPPELEVTAHTADGLVMALHHHELPLFGVQFHPESVLTPEGVVVLRNFLELAGEIEPEPRTEEPAPRPAQRPAVAAAIGSVAAGGSLSESDAYEVMTAVMDGAATDAQIASLVTAIRMKGESVDEIVGFARAMREHASPVRPRVTGVVDTCGTGGDGLSTFNISTTTAFVVAGAGVPIAKHGNRAVSSAAGSADVLEQLGVRIDLGPEAMARCIDEVGLGFLFAQSLHASMRHAAGPRREIAIRTVFNVLGPLTNPAGATRQLLGVYAPELVPVMAEVAGRLGAERVLVVHGHPGMDEVSASGPTTIGEFANGSVRLWQLTPEEVGIARGTIAGIAGGDAAANARILRDVLDGQHGQPRDIVLMNAAAALLAADRVDDMAEGVAIARDSIDTGEALARLEALATLTQRLAAEREAPA
ncbi:MAG: anthranilate phosphoribosyltransferase [Coriobacteriia bacterium]|nr:anthranilate phosphoribosyltransferase [Coriobacteriia bacterium]